MILLKIDGKSYNKSSSQTATVDEDSEMEWMVTEEGTSISACDGLFSFNFIFNYDGLCSILYQDPVLALLRGLFL